MSLSINKIIWNAYNDLYENEQDMNTCFYPISSSCRIWKSEYRLHENNFILPAIDSRTIHEWRLTASLRINSPIMVGPWHCATTRTMCVSLLFPQVGKILTPRRKQSDREGRHPVLRARVCVSFNSRPVISPAESDRPSSLLRVASSPHATNGTRD